MASSQPMAIQNYYDWHLYSCVVRILLLKKRGVVFKLLFLLSPTFLRMENDFLALESLVSIFGSMSISLAILELRYVNSFPSWTAFPCRMIGASQQWFVLMCLGLPTLTLSPSSEAMDTRSQVVAYMAVREWARREMSSAKSRPLRSW